MHLSLNIRLFDYNLLNMPTQLIGIWWNKTWGIILKWVCPTVSTIAYQECDCYLQCTREYLPIAIFNPSECYLETLYNILVLEMSEWYMEYSRMHNTKALSIWMYCNIPPIILSTVQHKSHNQGMSGQFACLFAWHGYIRYTVLFLIQSYSSPDSVAVLQIDIIHQLSEVSWTHSDNKWHTQAKNVRKIIHEGTVKQFCACIHLVLVPVLRHSDGGVDSSIYTWYILFAMCACGAPEVSFAYKCSTRTMYL